MRHSLAGVRYHESSPKNLAGSHVDLQRNWFDVALIEPLGVIYHEPPHDGKLKLQWEKQTYSSGELFNTDQATPSWFVDDGIAVRRGCEMTKKKTC